MLVKQYQPALRRTTLRLMDILSAEAEFITQTAEAWFRKKSRAPFEPLPAAIQRRCLQLGLFKLGLDVDFDLVERLRAAADQPVAVNPQTSVCRDAAGQVRLRPTAPIAFNPRRLTVDLTRKSGMVVFGRLKISWEIQGRGQGLLSASERTAGTEYFDADKVGPSIVLRHWRRGDRYQPIGMTSSVKLQDLFCNQKVPRAERHWRVIAATTRGELVWVQGLRIAELFKLDKGTVRRLKWDWQITQ
jgi:tRNA(Ile)-lysidine synthase